METVSNKEYYQVEVFSSEEGDAIYSKDYKQKGSAFKKATELSRQYVKGAYSVSVYKIEDGYATKRYDFWGGRFDEEYDM